MKAVGRDDGTAEPAAVVRHAAVATFKALRQLADRALMLSQARMQDNLILLCSMDAEKSTGEISLASADPREQPVIRLNYLSHPDDLPRLTANARTRRRPAADRPSSSDWARSWSPPRRRPTSPPTSRCTRGSGATSAPRCTRCAARGWDPSPIRPPSSTSAAGCTASSGSGSWTSRSCPNVIRRGPAATAVMIGERAAAFFDD